MIIKDDMTKTWSISKVNFNESTAVIKRYEKK